MGRRADLAQRFEDRAARIVGRRKHLQHPELSILKIDAVRERTAGIDCHTHTIENQPFRPTPRFDSIPLIVTARRSSLEWNSLAPNKTHSAAGITPMRTTGSNAARK
jgi:hypothetical protein